MHEGYVYASCSRWHWAGGTAFMAMEDDAGEDAAGAGARRAVSGTL